MCTDPVNTCIKNWVKMSVCLRFEVFHHKMFSTLLVSYFYKSMVYITFFRVCAVHFRKKNEVK